MMQQHTEATHTIILDRGRGPEIAGTRITVYDVFDYYRRDWGAEQIAALFDLPVDEIQSAIDYINTHRAEVIADYEKILSRQRSHRYSAEIQSIVDRCRDAADRKLAEIRRRRQDDASHAEDLG